MAEKDSDELAMPSDALRVVRTGTDGGTRPEILRRIGTHSDI